MLESLQWGQPRVNKTFGVMPEQVEPLRPWAFNQGFYNLFLSVAMAAGWVIYTGVGPEIIDGGTIGLVLMVYGLLSMGAAGVVLVVSNRRRLRGALVQLVPSLLGLGALGGITFVR